LPSGNPFGRRAPARRTSACARRGREAQASARRPPGKCASGTQPSRRRQPSLAALPRGQRRRCVVNRYLFSLRVTVKDGERALLTRNGRFERVLEPGRHTLFDPAHQLAVELHNVVRAEFPADRFAVLKTAQPELAAELFEEVATQEFELAI